MRVKKNIRLHARFRKWHIFHWPFHAKTTKRKFVTTPHAIVFAVLTNMTSSSSSFSKNAEDIFNVQLGPFCESQAQELCAAVLISNCWGNRVD